VTQPSLYVSVTWLLALAQRVLLQELGQQEQLALQLVSFARSPLPS
jgi:hypothetical protein